ncbi:TPA: replication initiator protein A [Enterococcus faecalis]
MSEFQFIKSKSVYGELYFQFPKVLMYGSKYKKISNDAKIAYMILKDRLEYSLRNNWVDEDDNVYFIYTNSELEELLNCSKPKIVKIKKELEEIGLLFQKRMGFNNKTKKNEPNRLYLAELEVNATDVYLRGSTEKNDPQTLDTSGSKNSLLPKNDPQTLDTSGSKNSLLPKNDPQTLGTSGSKNSLPYLYKEYIDTYKDTVKDTKKEDLQNRELLQSFSETQDQSFLDKRCLDLIALFSTSIQEAHETVGIIIRAKNKQEKKYDRTLVAEDWQEEIETTLRKVYHKIKTDHKIKNRDNYMFGAFCTTFENCILQMQAWEKPNDSNRSPILLHNWLEPNENN